MSQLVIPSGARRGFPSHVFCAMNLLFPCANAALLMRVSVAAQKDARGTYLSVFRRNSVSYNNPATNPPPNGPTQYVP